MLAQQSDIAVRVDPKLESPAVRTCFDFYLDGKPAAKGSALDDAVPKKRTKNAAQ